MIPCWDSHPFCAPCYHSPTVTVQRPQDNNPDTPEALTRMEDRCHAGARTMSDIFLSYASADLPRVRSLIRALERHGWSVVGSHHSARAHIRSGHRGGIRRGPLCDCGVVTALCEPDWVKTEAAEGARRRILVPVLLDEVRIPLSSGGCRRRVCSIGIIQAHIRSLTRWCGR